VRLKDYSLIPFRNPELDSEVGTVKFVDLSFVLRHTIKVPRKPREGKQTGTTVPSGARRRFILDKFTKL
jgi:hypothetical protein